ncbi:hypothetical protein D3C81_769090 [compost metagenome]
MSFLCPPCNSSKIASLSTSMKIGAVVGSIVGAARGAHNALTTPSIGAVGRVSSAVLGGLCAGVVGCTLGAQFGENLDRYVLASNRCLICRHSFNLPI